MCRRGLPRKEWRHAGRRVVVKAAQHIDREYLRHSDLDRVCSGSRQAREVAYARRGRRLANLAQDFGSFVIVAAWRRWKTIVWFQKRRANSAPSSRKVITLEGRRATIRRWPSGAPACRCWTCGRVARAARLLAACVPPGQDQPGSDELPRECTSAAPQARHLGTRRSASSSNRRRILFSPFRIISRATFSSSSSRAAVFGSKRRSGLGHFVLWPGRRLSRPYARARSFSKVDDCVDNIVRCYALRRTLSRVALGWATSAITTLPTSERAGRTWIRTSRRVSSRNSISLSLEKPLGAVSAISDDIFGCGTPTRRAASTCVISSVAIRARIAARRYAFAWSRSEFSRPSAANVLELVSQPSSNSFRYFLFMF